MNEIEQALHRIFTRHRIVLWYDHQRELRPEFEAVALPGVEKIVLANNAFSVKYRILRDAPKQKFLLYHEGPPPDDLDNWLLDVQLAYGQFRADRVALWLSEVGLGLEFADVIAPHAAFFQAAHRRESLKAHLKPDDTPRQVRMAMLAVCARAEPRLDDILRHLLAELAEEREEAMRLIERCALAEVLWEELARAYGYASESPGLRDFAITLFQSCYALEIGTPALGAPGVGAPDLPAPQLNTDALVFLKQWKDSVQHQAAFKTLSADCATILNIEGDLQTREVASVLAVETFELVDRKIISDLVRKVAQRTIAGTEVSRWVRRRRQSCWYADYEAEYAALETAAAFMDALEQANLTTHTAARTVAGMVNHYVGGWFQLDQHYRKFITHLRQSGQTTLFGGLAQQVENLYTNAYVLPVNTQWQTVLDGMDRWESGSILAQADIVERQVRRFRARDNKIFVVISDGMRYEIGEELLRLIRQEDRYDAELEPALTLLPSYTQLGMAALLPHTRLEIVGDGDTVLVDGQSSVGTENRKKILAQANMGRTTALLAKDLLAMTRDESRALFRDHDVVYVYHNRIDATGHKRDSEERVFDAVEATLEELVRIVKKLTNANVTNMLITADHGFLYQHQPLDESDFAGQEPVGEKIVKRDRRFVLGYGLRETSSFKHFSAAEMGLEGEMEILIPKTVNRLRLQGAGSRYVHGGAALQEIIIPILKINKKRESDVTQVEVDILRGASSIISTGQLTVTLYQTEAVTDKIQPRHLRAGIYTQAGVLISNRHDLTFDFRSENPREREQPVRFILTQKADAANEQTVFLRLQTPIEGTGHYQDYKTVRYTLRRSFMTDFEF